ncbi:uncharacterized protein BCR38DRAFT_404828 [Pseudomassariella vexata]|uniref:Uncharacterized protein n=1 Tax=Pseudomassariella vexata TaxID=1141098 RepID=A0A1Y2EJV8_9PEZI|nr:uncharacterized protein BCR38DRAFT_404828 [Pseudomassariella vexata]ORY71787.1 hypothetical protein BCR38DRAFT_404828 [Pseudomassariella vexata]
MVFSANYQDSLKRQINALSAHPLDPRVRAKLSDLSYKLSDRCPPRFCRAFLWGLPDKVSSIEAGSAINAKTGHEAFKTSLIFTGQGAQLTVGIVATIRINRAPSLYAPKQAQVLAALRHGATARPASGPRVLECAGTYDLVRLDVKAVHPYLDATSVGEDVFIAYYNSPASVTVSGSSALLAGLVETIKADSLFTRILQVEVTYHSHHMRSTVSHHGDLLKL